MSSSWESVAWVSSALADQLGGLGQGDLLYVTDSRAWLGGLRNARTAVAVVDWPEGLHEMVADFLEQSMHFEKALAEDDVARAAETVVPAHGSFHVLSGAGFTFLAEQAGLTAGEHGGGDDGHD